MCVCCNFVFKQLKKMIRCSKFSNKTDITRASNAYLLSLPNIMSTHSRQHRMGGSEVVERSSGGNQTHPKLQHFQNE